MHHDKPKILPIKQLFEVAIYIAVIFVMVEGVTKVPFIFKLISSIIIYCFILLIIVCVNLVRRKKWRDEN
jgi:hypothetical protein